MKATTKRPPLYDPSKPKPIRLLYHLNDLPLMQWIDHAVYLTEPVWNRIEAVPEQQVQRISQNLHELLFALWCKLFAISRDVRLFSIETPVVRAGTNQWELLTLRVRVSRDRDGNPTLLIMEPDDH